MDDRFQAIDFFSLPSLAGERTTPRGSVARVGMAIWLHPPFISRAFSAAGRAFPHRFRPRDRFEIVFRHPAQNITFMRTLVHYGCIAAWSTSCPICAQIAQHNHARLAVSAHRGSSSCPACRLYAWTRRDRKGPGVMVYPMASVAAAAAPAVRPMNSLRISDMLRSLTSSGDRRMAP